ncbi:MAG: hypothetical protein AB7Q17_16445 [Phycisphaerae bacterium]
MIEAADAPVLAHLLPRLEAFCRELRAVLKDNLVSVILYGGVVREEFSPRSSNVNVMLVANDLSIGVLDQIAPVYHRAARETPLAMLYMTLAGLARSSDVFAVKFFDMQRHRRVLFGRDVLAELPFERERLRFRCEQEMKNHLLRLRKFYVERGAWPDQIERALTRTVSSFLTSLSVAVWLKTGDQPPNKSETIDAAARVFGLEVRPLRDLLALKEGVYQPDAAALGRLYGDLMKLASECGTLVDAL